MANSPRSKKSPKELANARSGRYGIRRIDDTDGTVEGPFAKVVVVTDLTFGAGTEVAGGASLGSMTLTAGEELEAYFDKIAISGSSGELVAYYAETAKDENSAAAGQVARAKHPKVDGTPSNTP